MWNFSFCVIVLLVISVEKYNVQFKKKYGQNFLKRPEVVERIVHVCDITKRDLVIEVGPGGAILTQQLAQVAGHVLAYEIDVELREELERKLKKVDNVTILYQDFLESSIDSDIRQFSFDNIYFVSNVPYYITTPIVMKLIESGISFKKICMMVQKEVGERFSTLPGNKNYSSITVFLNYYYHINKEFLVSREEFVPIPKVDSVIVSFLPKEELLPLKDDSLFFRLVRDSFQFKRKNIRNNLKQYDLMIIEQVLKQYDFDLTIRAEQLSLEMFVDLANALSS